MIAPEHVAPGKKPGSWLSDLGLRLSGVVRALVPRRVLAGAVAVVIVFGATLLVGSSPLQSAQWFGAGFWDLVAFTMQMALIILTGYAVATSAPVFAIIRAWPGIPKTGRSAAAFVGLFSMLSSLAVVELQPDFQRAPGQGSDPPRARRRLPRGRRRGILGVGSVWALGLSSSAALIMAAPGSLPAVDSAKISGVIPLGQTLGLWQSIVIALVLGVLCHAICYYSAPEPEQAREHGRHGRDVRGHGRARSATRRSPANGSSTARC